MAFQKIGKVSKTQVELLAWLQNLETTEETWTEISRLIANFFAERASDLADKVAEEKGWTDEDFHRMANTHMRTPYIPNRS